MTSAVTNSKYMSLRRSPAPVSCVLGTGDTRPGLAAEAEIMSFIKTYVTRVLGYC